MHLLHTLFISKLRPIHDQLHSFINNILILNYGQDRPDKAIVLLLTNMENYKEYVLLRLQFVDNMYQKKSPWS